ncbi:ABC transporter ATP-binding protein [Lactobacillus sp. ESL0791]|uniref:ATP-binding cassette domain-containing protein n=1 Tax=Lactobacillus sp. ESL0791 TaxID=2983234 RepID=UPI0023F7B2AA|nr:ABC transporter ATP-binding protein [Lactobacillus sp. ESL0791]MDF7638331.1 ABC transporter ATP-binding protein [Lactobacillus sp. ESL0791]
MNLKGLIKTNWLRAILVLGIYVVYSYAGTMQEYVFKYVTNELAGGKLPQFFFWLLVQIGMGLLTVLLLPLATCLFTKQIQEYVHQLRSKLLQYYYFAGSEKVADMQNDLVNNMKVLTDDYATPWISIWSNLIIMAMSIGVLFSLHWSLILATIVAGIIVMLLPKIMEKKTATATSVAAKKNATFLNTVANWFGGLNELRRYSASSRLNRELRQSSKNLADANVKRAQENSIAQAFNGLGNAIGQAGISFCAGLLFFARQIDFGSFMIAGSFAFSIFAGLWQITSAVTQIKSTKKLRAETSRLLQSVKVTHNSALVTGVSGKNLFVKYDNGEQIAYPDFTIKGGDKVLLTGDSGSGKSTLFKLLLGQLKPAHGEIIYTGQDGQVVKPDIARIGYIAQDSSLFPDTIANNITMFNQKLQTGVKRVAAKVQLQTDLAQFPNGAETVVDLDQDNLSGGQKQKVVLARAELHPANLILCDEATSAIDRATTAKIIHELLNSDQTVIMIAHNFSPELRKMFDYEIRLQAKERRQDNDN